MCYTSSTEASGFLIIAEFLLSIFSAQEKNIYNNEDYLYEDDGTEFTLFWILTSVVILGIFLAIKFQLSENIFFQD